MPWMGKMKHGCWNLPFVRPRDDIDIKKKAGAFMKKRIAVLLAICLTSLMLCGCGKNSNVMKAEELIAAIGEVSMESETAIIAARVYYDTLSEQEQSKVETYDLLLEAENAFSELQYEEIYEKAVSYRKAVNLSAAYEELQKLPADFKNTQEMLDEITPYLAFEGKWVIDNSSLRIQGGRGYGFPWGEYVFSVSEDREGELELNFTTKSQGGLYNPGNPWRTWFMDGLLTNRSECTIYYPDDITPTISGGVMVSKLDRTHDYRDVMFYISISDDVMTIKYEFAYDRIANDPDVVITCKFYKQ